MPRLRPFLILAGLMAAVIPATAQSIRNTVWKAYYKPVNDTVTLRFANDSSFVTTPTGAAILLSTFKIKGDVIAFRDYDGLNACAADQSGSYHVKMNSDTLTLVMDEDPCSYRGGLMIVKSWVRVPAPAMPSQ